MGRTGGSYSDVGLGVVGRFALGMPMRCGVGRPVVASFGFGFGAAGAFVFSGARLAGGSVGLVSCCKSWR